MSVNYQDRKIRAIGRATLLATLSTALLAACLAWPDQVEGFVERLPLGRLGANHVWLAVLATMVPILWAVDLLLIFTSPAQEVRLVAWSKRWRRMTGDFERITFDPLDPDYRKAAWRYFLDRRRG